MSISHSRPTLDRDDYAAVQRTLSDGMIADGALRRSFEQAAGTYLGLPPGLATSSGTAALEAALRAVGVSAGDEVITPTYVCDAVAIAIRSAGAQPVLCDVEIDRCISRATVERRITRKTTAVVAVHPFGAVADIPSIRAAGVPVIEDCCQAFGASRDGRLAGTSGDACVLSFHATKLLTTGEGGMALSVIPAIAERLDGLHRDASVGGWHAPPLSDLQAALGVSQLARYPQFLQRRAALARFYFDALRDLDIELPTDVADRSVFFRFAVRSHLAFDRTERAFAAKGILVRRGVDRLLHGGGDWAGFPMAERLYAETVSLPIYPSMSDEDAARVAAAARDVFGTRT